MGEALPQSDAGPSEIEIRPLFEFADLQDIPTAETRKIRERTREKLSGALGPAGAFGGLGT